MGRVVGIDSVTNPDRRVDVYPVPGSRYCVIQVSVNEAALASFKVLGCETIAQCTEAKAIVERSAIHHDHSVPARRDFRRHPPQHGGARFYAPEGGGRSLDSAQALGVTKSEGIVVHGWEMKVHGACCRERPLIRCQKCKDILWAKHHVVQEQY